jgi:putative N6-adenine-specific DNA methylase
VSFGGENRLLYLANLHLRTPSRVIVRLGRFHASTFYELERRAKTIHWQNFLPANSAISLRVTCRKSRLYHSDAVAERILGVIAQFAPPGSSLQFDSALADDADGDATDAQTTGEGRPIADATVRSQSFVVRIVNDQCEISADSSGALLHRRGYRQEVAKAPLRETLAAAMILASGWQPNSPLVDPLCGSGTIPIEAALIARRIAPGLRRSFQFMQWPSFDAGLWKEILSKAESEITTARADIRGADRDAGAIAAATRNAERAAVADIHFATQPLSVSLDSLKDVELGEGWVLTNPPYGIRVGEGADLRNLYARLGTAVKAKSGWRLGLLVAESRLARQTAVPLRSRFDTRNGGIPVSFLASEKTSKSAVD